MRSAHARFRDTGLFFHPRSTSRAPLPVPSKSPPRRVNVAWHEPRKKKKERKGREKIRGRKESYRRYVTRLVSSLFMRKIFSVLLRCPLTWPLLIRAICVSLSEVSMYGLKKREENLVLSFLSRR